MHISLKKLTRTSDKFMNKQLDNVPNFPKQAAMITKGTKNIKPIQRRSK